ncbi:MAG TPA: transposase [Vicinamibacterales bacterium]|nr:transposase [Vicinamibacterales bacterium]
MATHGPGHLRAFDYIGLHRYFLTFCCHSQQPRFRNRTVVELVRAQIRRAAHDEQFVIPAYCFMPDHLHLLIEATGDQSNGLKFISKAKQLSGFHYKQRYRLPLWQRYGYEHVLRDDEKTKVVARYILENPVRAGLVKSPEDFPFLGSDTHSVQEVLEFTSG